MLNSLADQARSANLRWMKSFAFVIWFTTFALMLFLASVLAVLGNLVGLHGGEIAIDFLFASAGPGLLVPSKFSLILLFLVAMHFGLCWDWATTSEHHPVTRLSTRMMESIRLWSSTTVSAYVHFVSPSTPTVQLSGKRRTVIEGTEYLACDRPKLE